MNPTQPGFLTSLMPMVIIFLVFYFLLIRPQQTREKRRQAMISALQKGDRVLLTSGIYGKITKTGETLLGVEIAKGVVVEVERNAIASKIAEQVENKSPADNA